MPELDWRSRDSFGSLDDAEITDVAWEGLRQNVDYRRDYAAMIASSPDGAVTEEFRRRWGICFRPRSAEVLQGTSNLLGA
ncbi:transcriptional regulator domain-containing protein [Bradyrhizobium genosp. P]|uniref:transcriptional regulator domain-containing protein n=1 Tax=Bradyrhizobium genosp. P TaxID=83641 RepID=UPI003CEBEDC1